MTDETAFLTAIATTPHDLGLRLVYADWLEERDDPRHELIRIEEEMRQLPVFADRFWQLKPRRNDLRAQVPAEWGATLRYGIDAWPAFSQGIPDGWRERWRLIREFVERWRGWPMADVGGHPEKIRALEERLGYTLSAAVREWIAFRHDIDQDQPELESHWRPYPVHELLNLAALSLFPTEDNHDAVRHADMSMPNPPIYGYGWNGSEIVVPLGDEPRHETVTAFALWHILNWTGEGGCFGTTVGEVTSLRTTLIQTFPSRCLFGTTEIFETENILVLLRPAHMSSETLLDVKVAKRIPREVIPDFLWNYTHNGGHFGGLFLDQEDIPF